MKYGSSAVILSEDKTKVLLTKRVYQPYPDFWEIPGGHKEDNETSEECAVREMREETGLVVRVVKYIDKIINKKEKQTTRVYLCRLKTNRIELGAEVSDIKFYNLNDLPENMVPVHRDVLVKHKEMLSQQI